MIKTAYASNIGRVRKSNQDFVQIFKNKKNILMAIVADGMGGHQGGDVASSMAVNHLGHAFVGSDLDNVATARTWLKVNLNLENETILATSDRFSDLNGMGTTIVLAVLFAEDVLLAHLGDSRAYLLRKNEFLQVTQDHSLVNELLKSGQITVEQAKNHPQKNVITETLGVSKVINPEFTELQILEGDLLLLCTDGLTNSLTNQQIKDILVKQTSLQERSDELIAAANRFGGQDNITVCLISYGKEGISK
ncbi:phosphoprotein phosphatase [Amylolactobacillus amylotrophicus DSM 20534]|uniref:Phosphoprotein phosphatase n=3 Tax=Amylolactobacillus TaxID=2767876 RepID=A0A0R1YKH8_9LACO|nr:MULTISPECIES: Stp1/IreP family PP2C-type Ser/Thr phosphatase [Amylolactobacillus]APT17925.1 serine/threonine protein phosphatase [Amylolactobacillus amylophilus DSM 20533 = JCM 1125]KRK38365.1 phosphoprotein phosphatase [Amylolactobacillus amylotrophicus DSM 20534]KRM42992.1 phosphoprotein phosphatase [Amylolactobacillus amylophilus DSM 20533 = JCM 1125]GED79861.1 serine/threonine protein phosphatase [Amylolactobacillus amylophilus]